MKKKLFIVLGIFILIIIGICLYLTIFKKNRHLDGPTYKPNSSIPISYKDNDYNLRLIKTINSISNSNYLISPYSTLVALDMLSKTASGNTKEEISNIIKNNSYSKDIKGINIANAIFIKEDFKEYVNSELKNKLVSDYKSDIIYDKFKNPDKINKWVEKHTNNMIPKILDSIDEDYVFGLINALAIDVKWDTSFECINTKKEEFIKEDNSKIDVSMMHNSYSFSKVKYFNTGLSKGVILPYRESDLEFVGILPNDSVDEYIKNLNINELNNIDNINSNEYTINLSIPRFSYSYSLDNFDIILKSMGINDAFDQYKADFSNIISKEYMDKYVGNIYLYEAIHKTNIDLNEEGTKAAAVTYLGARNFSALVIDKQIDVVFNKPFIYIIRDSKSKDILFFGVVKEPNIWNGSTCK